MKHRILIATTLLAATACDPGMLEPTLAAPSASATSRSESPIVGHIYALSNATAGNEVLEFARNADGRIFAAGSFATSGTGTGAGLGSQGAVILTENDRFLIAVNAGSNDITSFRVTASGLDRVATVGSGGTTPISVTSHGTLVYVLNAGGTGNISGFRLDDAGGLTPIAGSTRSLGGAAVAPAEVAFTPDGHVLVVTEKAANSIATYLVASGVPSQPIVNASAGQTPFGFTFDRAGRLVVTEAFGGAPGASALSSYWIGVDGKLQVISASVPTTQTAACWAVTVNSGRFVYATNTGSASVSGYSDRDGQLAMLNANGRTGVSGTTPTDAALSHNSQFLYTLNSGDHSISEFAVNNGNGGLVSSGSVSGLPAGSVGLAAR
ncbi:MAG: beta-propeller fold lactonase family protein [bacterium]